MPAPCKSYSVLLFWISLLLVFYFPDADSRGLHFVKAKIRSNFINMADSHVVKRRSRSSRGSRISRKDAVAIETEDDTDIVIEQLFQSSRESTGEVRYRGVKSVSSTGGSASGDYKAKI